MKYNTLFAPDYRVEYETMEGALEAWQQIADKMGNTIYKNVRCVTAPSGKPAIAYHVTINDEEILKVFDDTDATQFTADVMQWLFSMLDGIANLD